WFSRNSPGSPSYQAGPLRQALQPRRSGRPDHENARKTTQRLFATGTVAPTTGPNRLGPAGAAVPAAKQRQKNARPRFATKTVAPTIGPDRHGPAGAAV